VIRALSSTSTSVWLAAHQLPVGRWTSAVSSQLSNR
jgi:hypothetical protein